MWVLGSPVSNRACPAAITDLPEACCSSSRVPQHLPLLAVPASLIIFLRLLPHNTTDQESEKVLTTRPQSPIATRKKEDAHESWCEWKPYLFRSRLFVQGRT